MRRRQRAVCSKGGLRWQGQGLHRVKRAAQAGKHRACSKRSPAKAAKPSVESTLPHPLSVTRWSQLLLLLLLLLQLLLLRLLPLLRLQLQVLARSLALSFETCRVSGDMTK